MLTFKQYTFDIAEVLTPAQRRKKSIAFKKSKHKRMASMRRNKGKMPKKEVLVDRAMKAARKATIIKKKLLPPELIRKPTSELSRNKKEKLEKDLHKHKVYIKKIFPKIFKKTLAKARLAMAKHKASKGDDHQGEEE
jgi:hypothetical protein